MGADEGGRSLLDELAHELRDALSPLAPAVDLARLRGFDGEAGLLLAVKVERALRRTRATLDAFVFAEQCAAAELQLALRAVTLAGILEAARAELPDDERACCTFVSDGEQTLVRADQARSAQVLRALLQRLAASALSGSTIEVRSVARSPDPQIRVRSHGGVRVLADDGWLMRSARRVMALQGGGLDLLRDGAPDCELVLRFSAEAAEADMPRHRSPHPAAGAAPLAQPAGAGGGHRILIVDDSVDVRRSYCEVLRALSYTVLEAADAEQALSALESGTPDVALIDIHLPRISGYRLAQAMRGRAGASIYLVMLSGVTLDASTRGLARAAGFDECLDKMAGPTALRELIASAVARRSPSVGAPA
jgi:CheY-like chemotaxis protein